MTTVEHSTLTGSALHENKGVASATTNTVATASSGATVWQKLTASHLTGTGNPFGGQLFHSTMTTSQVFGSSGTWTNILLGSTLTNEISGASIAASVITLPAGTYFVDAWCLGSSGAGVECRLYNVTDSAVLVTGSVVDQAAPCVVKGRFTISGTKSITYQLFPESAFTQFSTASSSGYVFAGLLIWKVA